MPYDCTTETQCCCNSQIEQIIRSYLGESPVFPVSISTISIFPVDNNTNSSTGIYSTIKVYGICNGILWAQVNSSIGGESHYIAIPLCSIFGLSKSTGGGGGSS